MKLLTNLIFEPKGMHDPALAYSIKDTVMSPDGSRVYFALQDVPAGIALADEDYWILQMDLSASKAAMDEAVANFADYARQIGTKVRGETARATGNPVTFLPDAGSLLQPVTVLEPRQAGSGDPSPENIRSFIGWDAFSLNHRGENAENTLEIYTVQIGQMIYGGRFDWLTGKLYAEWAAKTLTGDETPETYTNATSGNGVTIPSVFPESMYRVDGVCSHALVDNVLSVSNIVMCGNNNKTLYWTSILDTLGMANATEFKAWLAAQNATGTPVQIVYKLATPIEIQLTPHIIAAADPEQNNTLYGDGIIEVEYVKPLHVSIEERVAAIASAMLMQE